jgi:D-3-phosphoglycerate dehydrogenase
MKSDSMTPNSITTSIAIVGDRFMLPSVFAERISAACGNGINIRTLEQPWPDEPMEHGYAGSPLDRLKEFMGQPDEVAAFIGDAALLVTHLAPISRAMLERLPSLRFIAVSRGGPVNIDLEAARDHDVLVVNTPGRNATAVAEFTIGAILSETRLIRSGHEALRAGEWRGDLYRADRTGRELSEMTVGIVGYGAIGSRVVKLLKAFGCRLLVTDPYVQLSAQDRADGVEHVALGELLARADVITLHARVTPETTGFIGRDALARMRKDAILINTARGPLVDYEALHDALASGRLGGAMLDTFAVEPAPPDWPLLRLPNVTLTPHIAGASVRTVTIAAEQAAEEVRRFLAGEPPLNPC